MGLIYKGGDHNGKSVAKHSKSATGINEACGLYVKNITKPVKRYENPHYSGKGRLLLRRGGENGEV